MAALYNTTIEKGATFRKTFVWRDSDGELVDLTGFTARMQIRRSVTSSTAEVSLTSSSGIVLGTTNGQAQVTISATVTAALEFTSGVYDLEFEDADGFVTRLVEGSVQVKPEVTR